MEKEVRFKRKKMLCQKESFNKHCQAAASRGAL